MTQVIELINDVLPLINYDFFFKNIFSEWDLCLLFQYYEEARSL